MTKTFNTPSKIKIRKEWNFPIIKLISEITNKKLIYLGLPSPAAEDILEWIVYIDKVIAFQCRNYRYQSDQSQSKKAIEELEAKLNILETQGKISTFSIYDGYIEEVLLKGQDTSNISYFQNDIITLYNLDYCNSLSVPIRYLDLEGNIKEGYKFQAIQKLLDHQKSIRAESKKFILFLTISCNYYEPEMIELLSEGCEKNLREVHRVYNHLEDENEKSAHLLRSYTILNLKEYFISNGFIPEFLPTINYNGKPKRKIRGIDSGDHILLHFSVLGTQMEQAAGVAPFYQDLEDLIKQKFIYIRDGEVVTQEIQLHEDEIEVKFTPEINISESNSFKKYWKIDE